MSDPILPFEFIKVGGSEALVRRSALRSRSGITPVLMGATDDARLLEEVIENSSETPEGIIEKAGNLDVEQWLQSQVEGDSEHYSVEQAPWPSEELPAIELSLHRDSLSKRPRPHVIIGLVPTAHAWEVPAYLKYGGWNACPAPEVHVAIHKMWNAEYGSEIACISGDVIECTVARPPSSRDSGMKLAREQFLYCSDIVHQGAGSLEALAATLLRSNAWYFWWD